MLPLTCICVVMASTDSAIFFLAKDICKLQLSDSSNVKCREGNEKTEAQL